MLGIDFGTSNSVVAVYRRRGDGERDDQGDHDDEGDDGDVEVLANDIEARTTPSCVHLHPTHKLQVGEAALRMASSDPKNTVHNVKQVLGRTFKSSQNTYILPPLGSVDVERSTERNACVLNMHYPDVALTLRDRTVHPEEVAAAIFRDLRETARLRLQQDVRRAVIGVPSYFNSAQRLAVMQAAELAGLRVERLCDETSAAALAYARVSPKEGVRKVVIVDVGGGGGSAAVVEVQSRFVVRVLASSGTRLFGGEDLDATMLILLREKKTFNSQVWEKLRFQWREAKKKLSFSHPSADIKIYSTESKEDICFEVTQEDLNEPFCYWCEGIMEGIKKVMMDANIVVGEVKDVILIGASGRFPKLRVEVEKLFNKKCCKIVNADEGVAIGAALLGARLASLSDITSIPFRLSYKTYLINTEIQKTPAQTQLPHFIYKHTMYGRDVEIYQSVSHSEGNVCHSKCHLNWDDEIHININGIFEKVDDMRRKKRQCIFTRSNLPEGMLNLIQQKMIKQEKHNIAECRRLETRNLLEEKLRRILSLSEVEVLGSPNYLELSPEDIRKDLLWVERNPNESERNYILRSKKYENLSQILEKADLERRRKKEEILKSQLEAEREAVRVKKEEELRLQREEQQRIQEEKEQQKMQVEKEQQRMLAEKEQQRMLAEKEQRRIQEEEDQLKQELEVKLQPGIQEVEEQKRQQRNIMKESTGHAYRSTMQLEFQKPLAPSNVPSRDILRHCTPACPSSAQPEKCSFQGITTEAQSSSISSYKESTQCLQSNNSQNTSRVDHSARPLPLVHEGTLIRQEMNQHKADFPRNMHLQEEQKLLLLLREHFLTAKISFEELRLWKEEKDLIQGAELSDLVRLLIDNQEAVLQDLAKDACVQVLTEALSAHCVLLTGKCQGPSEREFIFIAVRYISHQEPVECLLALVDSSASGRELYNYFNNLCFETFLPWKKSVLGISMDGTPACTEFYKLLRSEDPHVAEVWNSSHRLDEKIALKCYSYDWGKKFFGVIDLVRELFMKDRWFKVLLRQCSSVEHITLVTYEEIVNLLYYCREEVCKALTKILTIEPKVFYIVNFLKSNLADDGFFTLLVVFHKILSVMKGTSEVLKFSTEIDIMVLTNCYSTLHSKCFMDQLIADGNKVREISGGTMFFIRELRRAAQTVLTECLQQCATSLRDYLQLKGDSNIDKLNEFLLLTPSLMSHELLVNPISFSTPYELLNKLSLRVTHPCAFRAASKLLTMPLFPSVKKWTVAKLQKNLFKALPYPSSSLAAMFVLQSTAEEVHQINNVKKIIENVQK